jgi:hypothetical protein
MVMQHAQERRTAPDPQEQERLDALIGSRVLSALGQPGDLHAVQVRRLWDNRYRVNVFTGVDATSAGVANSYFIVADDGNITAATPALARQY